MTSGRQRTLQGVSDIEALFREHADRVHAYARRHVEPSTADDIVSETFLVAWRRRADLPEPPLPWLLVTARNLIANHRRSGRRADQHWLAAVREHWNAPTAMPPDEALAEREAYLQALQACTRPEREALLLVAWDGLSPSEAAAVAGCSVRAFTVRLSRARARMERSLRDGPTEPRPQHSPRLVPTQEIS